MPTRDPIPSTDAIREAVRLRVSGASLRVIAKEIGIAHQSLYAFLEEGREPYGKNLGKLVEWYGRGENEVARLRREVAELRKKLAECEAQLRKR